MKTCGYCGRENDDSLSACRECGTEFSPVEARAPSPTFSRRTLRNLGLVALAVLGVLGVMMPYLLLAIPLLAIFYLPIYGPLLLSFTITSHRWRGLRWSLRAASLVALVVWFSGMADRPDFGDDVAGNIAGASHNFVWTWGSGTACTLVALIVGLLLRAFPKRQPCAPPNGGPATQLGNSDSRRGRHR
jgi:hypothetical protein